VFSFVEPDQEESSSEEEEDDSEDEEDDPLGEIGLRPKLNKKLSKSEGHLEFNNKLSRKFSRREKKDKKEKSSKKKSAVIAKELSDITHLKAVTFAGLEKAKGKTTKRLSFMIDFHDRS
jgi:hypothetical protein